MTNYTDQDLQDAYARLARALDIHRLALRDRPFDIGTAWRVHLDRLDSTRDNYQRCFKRYMDIADHLSRLPLGERPRSA